MISDSKNSIETKPSKQKSCKKDILTVSHQAHAKFRKHRRPHTSAVRLPGKAHYDMIVFSNQPWDESYKRQQPIMKRLSALYNILYVEASVRRDADSPSVKIRSINNSLTILQPQVNDISEVGSVMSDFTRNETVGKIWFFGPEYTPVLNSISGEHIVYDCMQDFQNSDDISANLRELDEELIRRAELVFTSNKALYISKKMSQRNVHFFPGSVDLDHFSLAHNGEEIPDDISRIRFPVVGYCGVIDEHIDLELISRTAQLKPHVSFVLVGPVENISELDLPQQKNIFFLGSKTYEILPAYMKYFSAAIMPFSESNPDRHACATKALEFMAAGMPIITTRGIDDFRKSVHVANTPGELAQKITEVLANPFDIPYGQKPYADILEATSWKKTVQGMNDLLSRL